jgi:diguanylate cyclase (GGDEF)-like protein/PAS domain S-box-containing protein
VTEETLHLIFIDDSSNDTEAVSNVLRNGGHPVRAKRVEDGEDLRAALAEGPCDVILSKIEISYFSAVEALAIVHDMQMDVPLVALITNENSEKVVELLQAGARDAVLLEDSIRLEHALMRELTDLNSRRALKSCELQLEEANKRAQGLVDSSRDAIAYVHEGMHVYANASYLQLFGYTGSAEIEGMPMMNMVALEDHGKFKEVLRQLGKPTSIEVNALKMAGDEFQTIMEFSPTHYEGEACTQVIIRDRSGSKELEAKLDSLSKMDLLTGLFNRQHFLTTLEQALSTKGAEGAVLYIEPDRFHATRDEIGIAASDTLIADLAGLLQKILGSSKAVLARFDSSVFTILLPGSEVAQAEKVARVLLKRVADHVSDVDGRTVHLTASIGITAYNESVTSIQQVLNRADKARRKAGEDGGNTLHIYNPAAEEMAEQERALIWSRKLKLALRDNAFFIVFQPIVSLKGDRNEHYEVYLRMVDDGNEVNPVDFISAAGEAGLMVAIDRWVLHQTVRKLMECRQAGRTTTLFVNLSDPTLQDANFLVWLRDLLKAARIDGGSMVVEIPEASAQANIRSVKALFEGLKQLHVRTAIDHFGTSENSVHLLRHISSDYLKLDGTLMEGFARNRDQQLRVKQLGAVAKEAKSMSVAEFVEDAATLAALWSCDIDYIQGYFMAKPGRELDYDFSGGEG